MRQRVIVFLIALSLSMSAMACLGAIDAQGQNPPHYVYGIVRLPDGTPLAGCDVTVITRDASTLYGSLETTTDANGSYSLNVEPIMSSATTILALAVTQYHRGDASVPVDASQGGQWLNVSIPVAELEVDIEASDASPAPNGTLTFTISIDNTGGYNATRVWVNATLPEGFELASATLDGAPVTVGAALALVIDDLTINEHVIVLSGTVGGSVANGTSLDLDVEVEYLTYGLTSPASTGASGPSVLVKVEDDGQPDGPDDGEDDNGDSCPPTGCWYEDNLPLLLAIFIIVGVVVVLLLYLLSKKKKGEDEGGDEAPPAQGAPDEGEPKGAEEPEEE